MHACKPSWEGGACSCACVHVHARMCMCAGLWACEQIAGEECKKHARRMQEECMEKNACEKTHNNQYVEM